MSDVKVVLVSLKSDDQEQPRSHQEDQLHHIKVTNNLINEINFNSTLNRFEYLEELLSKQHTAFLNKMNLLVAQQKDALKYMRSLQKEVKDIKLPSINYNRIMAQAQDLIKLKQDSDKNHKLSQGMLAALSKL